MTYKEWLAEVFRHINKMPLDIVCTQSVADFPTVDFRHLHRAKTEPEVAAIIAKSIRWYSLPVDKIKKKAIYSSSSKSTI